MIAIPMVAIWLRLAWLGEGEPAVVVFFVGGGLLDAGLWLAFFGLVEGILDAREPPGRCGGCGYLRHEVMANAGDPEDGPADGLAGGLAGGLVGGPSGGLADGLAGSSPGGLADGLADGPTAGPAEHASSACPECGLVPGSPPPCDGPRTAWRRRRETERWIAELAAGALGVLGLLVAGILGLVAIVLVGLSFF
ncbi:MAG: hypothetical protein AB8G96_15230 [Phycisphaerales bacterium]